MRRQGVLVGIGWRGHFGTPILNAKRIVPLDRLALEVWLQMIQEDLLGTKIETRLFLRN
jgi:hypothetical protein